MAQRGRKSGASLAVLPFTPKPPRPAPKELTKQQAAVWRDVTEAMPGDWFDTAPALLMQYCRHIDNASTVAKLVDSFDADIHDPESMKEFGRLLGMQADQSSAIAMLATKMRLTQQSRYNAQNAATAVRDVSTLKKPWE